MWNIVGRVVAGRCQALAEAEYIKLRRRPPEDDQGNARNM